MNEGELTQLIHAVESGQRITVEMRQALVEHLYELKKIRVEHAYLAARLAGNWKEVERMEAEYGIR